MRLCSNLIPRTTLNPGKGAKHSQKCLPIKLKSIPGLRIRPKFISPIIFSDPTKSKGKVPENYPQFTS